MAFFCDNFKKLKCYEGEINGPIERARAPGVSEGYLSDNERVRIHEMLDRTGKRVCMVGRNGILYRYGGDR